MNDSRMTFEEFSDIVKENIKDYLPEAFRDAEITTGPFQKLNGSYMGMQIRHDGQEAVPTVNLERYYTAYTAGAQGLTGMDAVLRDIAESAQGGLGLETDWLKDYSRVKDSLFIRVNDAGENAQSLANLPHQEVDGLAVSYHIAMEGPNGMEASVPVTYDLMKMYGIDESRLHTDALASSPTVNPPVFMNMADMMSRLTGIDADELAPSVPGPELMVLSNEQALFGAGSLFYPDMMDTVADWIGGQNYFVLPSSVHEVLLVADDGTMDRHELETMVQDINEMAVAPEDRLSDHVYHYDAKDHVLEKAETFDLRMQQKEIEAEKAVMETASKTGMEDAPRADAPRENGLREPMEADLKAGIPDREASGRETAGRPETGKETSKEGPSREGALSKEEASHDRDGHRKPAKKERKSVLARLNEKKEQVNSAPKRDAPHRSKSTELG